MVDYQPPFFHRNAHLATVLPNRLRSIPHLPTERKTLSTADNDFFDVDCVISGSETAIILLHGLEGSSKSRYIHGMAKALMSLDSDILCMNFRGCSGRTNATFQSYHSGKTDDLHALIDAHPEYKSLHIIGFSLGGNVALKFAGEKPIDERVKSCIAISAPVDLAGSSAVLSERQNILYLNRFLRQLKSKALDKANRFTEYKLNVKDLQNVNNFHDFDNIYTAPAHGFADANDYYKRSSSKQFLAAIKIPTLIINALNDSFLSPSCFPIEECKQNANLHLLTPQFGGHVGFANDTLMRKQFWHEQIANEFIANFTA